MVLEQLAIHIKKKKKDPGHIKYTFHENQNGLCTQI